MPDLTSSGSSSIAAVREFAAARDEEITAAMAAKQPFLVRGLVNDWPLVRAARQSPDAVRDYLLALHEDRPFVVSIGSEAADGRIFYRNDMGLNVSTGRARLPEIFERIARTEAEAPQPIIYLASIDTRTHFNGFREANPHPLGRDDCLESIWIGTKTRIAAHNDFPDNLACVGAGRRRFTLFPPDQFANLYLGPLDNTPAGRAISMVDLHAPDLDRYPDFATALQNAQCAEMEPGDALFIPSLWWHHVEALEPFNVLVNYWWRDTPRYYGQPQDALNHAIMSIRNLPDEERAHWRALFDHYVFGESAAATGHLPPEALGILGEMTPENASKIRTYLLRALNQ